MKTDIIPSLIIGTIIVMVIFLVGYMVYFQFIVGPDNPELDIQQLVYADCDSLTNSYEACINKVFTVMDSSRCHSKYTAFIVERC